MFFCIRTRGGFPRIEVQLRDYRVARHYDMYFLANALMSHVRLTLSPKTCLSLALDTRGPVFRLTASGGVPCSRFTHAAKHPEFPRGVHFDALPLQHLPKLDLPWRQQSGGRHRRFAAEVENVRPSMPATQHRYRVSRDNIRAARRRLTQPPLVPLPVRVIVPAGVPAATGIMVQSVPDGEALDLCPDLVYKVVPHSIQALFDEEGWQVKGHAIRGNVLARAVGPMQLAVKAEDDLADSTAADLRKNEAAEQASAAAETMRHTAKEIPPQAHA